MNDGLIYAIWHRIRYGHKFEPHFDGGVDKWSRLPTVDGCTECMK